MRAAADFLPEGGAGVRAFGVTDGPAAGGGSVAAGAMAGLFAKMLARSRADGDAENRPLGASGGGAARPAGRRFGGDDEEPDSSLDDDSEVAEKAQQNEDSGVEEDMATLVLDNAALGTGPGLAGAGPQPSQEPHVAGAAAADPNSDAAIMLRVAAGDEAGFNYLVGKYHRAMINFLYRMVHNQAVAEELAQEVFLRVYRSRESYRAEAKFTTWLYRIATNLAVNNARDTKHERAAQNVYLDVPDEETGTTPEVADDRPSVEQSLLKDERMAAIRKHVMALPERQRTAVLMHKYQGLDYRQIGEVLKLSESATKSLLFRAYQTLREKLKEFV
ncbi:RNA polymerase sigma factor [Occallatibacter riparius]|uniref:RNA polymerase sigma factor n=1 Tax=Occallatibacter riparius TaxID=1002689 RepID=A0A9J7BQ12_9BACT|nr:sigma-70 family RNA polymerase sigma factor [Occallatibacter riparius]UWZ83834.1 sigma-70 family RNA polymerase sigma factor [Occallatibacter riparius]